MRYDIVRDPRNRIYFRAPEGISVPNARRDGERQWIGLATAGSCTAVRQLIDGLVAERDQLVAAHGGYDRLKSAIPTDYRRRHGSLLGGTVAMNGETMTEIPPAFGELRKAQWVELAHVVLSVGHIGYCAGRPMDESWLYRCTLRDGRDVWREVTSSRFGDDQRESYWLPADLFDAVVQAEIRVRGITPEAAQAWLDQYHGCVGTELYEAALEQSPEQPSLSASPRRRSLPDGTGVAVGNPPAT